MENYEKHDEKLNLRSCCNTGYRGDIESENNLSWTKQFLIYSMHLPIQSP